MSKKSKKSSARVTLSAVARDAGVSISTASLILSEHPEYLHNFHPDTVVKVRASATRLGYRANLFASGLPSRGSSFFALVLSGAAGDESSRAAHWRTEGQLLEGVVSTAIGAGVYPVLATAPREKGDGSQAPIERIVAGGVFGSILRSCSNGLRRVAREQLAAKQPVVITLPDDPVDWPSNVIHHDPRATGRRAGELFGIRRRRSWLVVGCTGSQQHDQCLEGAETAARTQSAKVQALRVTPGSTEEVLRQLAPKLKRTKFDAVLIQSPSLAEAVVAALEGMGQRPGEDVCVVSCGCDSRGTERSRRLTSIETPWYDAGVTAMRTLLQLRDAGEYRFDSIRIEPRVVVGDTCAV